MLPVYVPPAGFSAGVGCWRHIGAADAERVAQIYDRAIAETQCLGCGAEAGAACRENDANGRSLPMVDGQWPKMRSFRNRKVHDVRLLKAVDGP